MDTLDAVASFRAAQSSYLPGHLGLDWSEIRPGIVRGHFKVGRQHLAPNGYLHAASASQTCVVRPAMEPNAPHS